MSNLIVPEMLGWKAHARIDKWDNLPEIMGDLKLDYEPDYQELVRLTGGASQVDEYDGNVLTQSGISLMFQQICNIQTNGSTAFSATGANAYFNNANSRLGVGSGSTTSGQNATVTAASTDTGLVADPQAANVYYMTMTTAYPNAATTIDSSGRTWQWQATFATGVANFVWQEWCIDNGVTAGTTVGTRTILNHKGISMGTKTSASSWTFTATIQIN